MRVRGGGALRSEEVEESGHGAKPGVDNQHAGDERKGSIPREHGTYKKVQDRLWPELSGKRC